MSINYEIRGFTKILPHYSIIDLMKIVIQLYRNYIYIYICIYIYIL